MRIKFRIDLTKVGLGDEGSLAGYAVRPPMRSDAEDLSYLMLEAYRGTIDYEGEDIEEARAAIDEFFEKLNPMLSGSTVVIERERLVSACLVIRHRDHGAFIGWVMTHPDYKGHGIGSGCVEASLRSLRLAGEDNVTLFITKGNTPSERLFESIGAKPVD